MPTLRHTHKNNKEGDFNELQITSFNKANLKSELKVVCPSRFSQIRGRLNCKGTEFEPEPGSVIVRGPWPGALAGK